jgi:hypothetical protein
MKHILTLFVSFLAVLAVAACSTTPTTPEAGQQAGEYLPTLDGYQVTQADSITDAITTAAGDGAQALDNPAVAAAVNSVDSFIDCYTEVGAVAANIYTQTDLASILAGGSLVPSVGTVAVVNQNLVQENFVACATSSGFSAASATEICRGSGQFTAADDTFRYIYIGSNASFCGPVEAHFAGLSS